MVLVLFIANIWGAEILPYVSNGLLAVHILGWLAIIITLWALAPRQSASVVFTQFTDAGGWSTIGLSLMVGQITAIFASTCKENRLSHVSSHTSFSWEVLKAHEYLTVEC